MAKATKKKVSKKVEPQKVERVTFTITTKELAEKLGTTPKNIRNFLRTQFEHLRSGEYTAWGWNKWNDPQLKEIMSTFNSGEKALGAPAKKKVTEEPKPRKKATKKVADEETPKKKVSKKSKEETVVKKKKKKRTA